MPMTPAVGRPRASSRETLSEAACELFLEQGFAATSISDIAARAGVSRSSFFNYFSTKSDVFWAGLDERITRLEVESGPGAAIDEMAAALVDDLQPDALALAIVNAEQMALVEQLQADTAHRHARITAALAPRLRSRGAEPLRAAVAAAAHATAVLAAIELWARAGAAANELEPVVRRALDFARPTLEPEGAPSPKRPRADR